MLQARIDHPRLSLSLWIINVFGYAQWEVFKARLRDKGFSESMEDDVICRMRLGELKVDFMPDNEKILASATGGMPPP